MYVSARLIVGGYKSVPGTRSASTLVTGHHTVIPLAPGRSRFSLPRVSKPNLPEELTQHNCLVYRESRVSQSWPFRMPNGESIMVKAQGNLTCNNGQLMVNAALEGLGIGFGPNFLFKMHIDTGALQLLLPDYQQPTAISALYPLNRNLPRRVRVLIDFLDEHLSIYG